MPSLFFMALADDLDPERVSKALGLRPHTCWRKGEKQRFVSKSGRTHWFRSTHKWGGWKFRFPSPMNERTLIRKVATIATNLSKRKTQLRALVKSGHALYLVSLIQDTSSLIIPPELHDLLGSLGIHLQIDFLP